MAFIKDVSISSIGEPASVKIEKNSKGYNIEVGLHGETLQDTAFQCIQTMRSIETELAKVSA